MGPLGTILLYTVTAAAFSPPHPCIAYPEKVSILNKCASASEFCSSYLGGPASFTRTYLSTTTIPVTEQVTTTTTTSTQTTTTTTLPHVFTSSNPNMRRAIRSRDGSCGIRQTQSSVEISGACNCILASSTIVITDVTTTSTSTSTSTVSVISTQTSTEPFSYPTPACNVFQLKSSGPAYMGSIAGSPFEQSTNLIFDGSYPPDHFSAQPNGQIVCLNISSTPLTYDVNNADRGYEVEIGDPSYLNDPASDYYIRGSNFQPLLCDATGSELVCTHNDGTLGVFGIPSNSNIVQFVLPTYDPAQQISLEIVPKCGGS